MPEISIIVPVYKVENYIRKCIDSILSQTFTSFELFLVDDGSPDNCGAICDEYAKRDERITVIHKKNGGLSDARNVAIDMAKCDLITFIDSDDFVSEDHLESLYNALTETDAAIAASNITSFENGKFNPDFYRPTEERKLLKGNQVFDTLYQPCAQAKLYKRAVFGDIRYPVGRLYEDAFVYHDILAKAGKLVLTGSNTYFYTIREGSILHQEYKLAFTDIIDAVELRIAKLEELGLQKMADENREFVYSSVAVAFANLDASIPENKMRLDEIKYVYDKEYPKLMKTASNAKQKFRYRLLYRNPKLHSNLFGKKMSKVLG